MASSRQKVALNQTFRKGRDDILTDLSAKLNGLSLKEYRSVQEKKGDQYFRGHDCQNCFEDLAKVTSLGRRSTDVEEEGALVGKIGYYCSFCSMEEPYCSSCINEGNMGAFCAGKDCGKMCCFECKDTPNRGWIRSRINKAEGFCSRKCAESISDDVKTKHLGERPNYSIHYQCEEEDCCKSLSRVASRKMDGDQRGTGYYCNHCYSIVGGMKKIFCTKCLTDVGKLCSADCGKMFCGDCTEFMNWFDDDGGRRYCSRECIRAGPKLIKTGLQDEENKLVGDGRGYNGRLDGGHQSISPENLRALRDLDKKLLELHGDSLKNVDEYDGESKKCKEAPPTTTDTLEEYGPRRCRGVTQKGERCKINAAHRFAKAKSLKLGQNYCLYHGGTIW